MDPVTAFSLAAGVLQVLDLSLKALGKCEEIYEDGSLAQHRQTEEITKALADTSDRLQSSAHSAPTAASKESEDVIDLSRKCSATAKELLSELRKLQLDPGDSRLKAMMMGVRAFRRKKFLTETENKLQKYQTILNTRVLSRLDLHAIQQIEKTQQLDQYVKELAKALSEGRHTAIIQGHIDRRFDDQAQREAKQRLRRDFKKNLFFPEMFARRDDIPRSHEGTCCWMLKPLEQRNRLDDGLGCDNTETRVPPESNFVEWLKKGEEIYWLNGKPGAGKSTLMKYISTKVPELHQSGQVLSDGGADADLVACSFFFWSLGAPLQKDYVGFIRSLLYQIAEQRDDAISIMMGNSAPSTKHGEVGDADDFAPSYMWTIERLDDALRRFLDKKPASLHFHVFIDGLDEFAGDEDRLLQTLRLLAQTPGTRVCVSSRPEQIFRQGFASSPQLKLQDFNYHDIEKASREQLEVTLAQHFPDSPGATQNLIQDIARKSSGILLWADLMNKIIKRGSINEDTLLELRKRLDHTPSTIDGLYQDMLSRLDKEYLRDAAKYMHMLLIDEESVFYQGLTLLHFACLEQSTGNHKMSNVATYDQSTEFDKLCRNLETRILARCGGLVEIVGHGKTGDQAPAKLGFAIDFAAGEADESDEADSDHSGARGSITRNLRPVRFIHKTAADFVRKHDEFAKDQKWPLQATLALTRSRIEGLALIPLIKTKLQDANFRIDPPFLEQVLTALPQLEAKWPFEEDLQSIRNLAFDTMNRTFVVADYVYTSLKIPDSTFSSQPNNNFEHRTSVFFHSWWGCAAFHGCSDYVRRCVTPSICSGEMAEEIIDCALNGLRSGWPDQMALNYVKIFLDFIPQSRSQFWKDGRSDDKNRSPRWLTFVIASLGFVCDSLKSRKQSLFAQSHEHRTLQQSSQPLTNWKLIFESILDHNVDVSHPWTIVLENNLVQRYNAGIRLDMNESILSTLKRKFTPLDPVFAEDIVGLLERKGAVERRDCVSIGTEDWSTSTLKFYQLTQVQSERLLQLPLENLFDFEFGSCKYQSQIVDLQVADQPLPEAEELLDLLCQEAEHPGSVFKKRSWIRSRSVQLTLPTIIHK